MKQQGKFRRMLIAVDACHAGVLGPALEAQAISDVVLLAAAAAPEISFSANYASALDVWAAFHFSFHRHQRVLDPGLSISDLYAALYRDVAGSHVQAANLPSHDGDALPFRTCDFSQ